MKYSLGENRIRGLKLFVGGSQFSFIGYLVNLQSGEVFYTLIKTEPTNLTHKVLVTLLSHYSIAKKVERAEKHKIRDSLPGDKDYKRAFLQKGSTTSCTKIWG